MRKKLFFFFFAVLVGILMLLIFSFSKFAHTPSNEQRSDYPPMVMYNDTLYKTADYNVDDLSLSELNELGEIQSTIDYGVPKENFQANDALMGCKIYSSQTADDYIFVLYGETYLAYKKLS